MRRYVKTNSLGVILWLVASIAVAQTTALIDGPTVALPGELVVLNSAKSVGDNHKWITPEGLSTAQAGCDAINSQVFFATPKIGKYEFILIVSDKLATIEFARHTVEVKQLTAPEPPPIVTPPPANPGEFAALRDLSRVYSVRLNDSSTRAALATNLKATLTSLKSQCAAGQCPTLSGAQAIVVRSIEDTLLARARQSRNADWEAGWRSPNNALIATYQITTVPRYLDAIDALATGLE